jgi:poly-gamma-glutamate capsule biosynthesis protein CapA/YwtB (metallophosphatase superfamily)
MKKKAFFIKLSISAAAFLFQIIPLNGRVSDSNPIFLQVHFTNPISNISSADLRKILSGKVANFKDIGGINASVKLFADEKIFMNLKNSYPALHCRQRSFRDEPLLSERGFLGISGAEGLSPCFKTLYIDRTLPWGQILDDYSIDDQGTYPFTADWAQPWDTNAHVSVVQTGVTAMTRAFIPAVARSGDLLSPIRYTKKITSQADLATTSNEVSFLEPCTYPLKNNMLFCAPLRFFSIMKESGFGLIELTGNHNNDFGAKYNLQNIEMLDRAGIKYFGGGKNKKDADSVRYITIKGTRLAFTGFNECGPDIAWATDARPGAARLSLEPFKKAVAEAVQKADIVFVTVQWCNENEPVPQSIQKRYFRLVADMGATVMVSSSAHRPMGLEFYRGRFISYGLGNFLFDQMQSVNNRRGLIARHHLYRGRHIATELIPYMIYDYSQPRLLFGREARMLMEEVFRYSIGPAFR